MLHEMMRFNAKQQMEVVSFLPLIINRDMKRSFVIRLVDRISEHLGLCALDQLLQGRQVCGEGLEEHTLKSDFEEGP